MRLKTERRLKALEKDLEDAERVRKEKTLAKKYHAIKFFGAFRSPVRSPSPRYCTHDRRVEKQKVTRKLTRVKKQLEESTDKSEQKKLKKELNSLRIDLNYILVRSPSASAPSLPPPLELTESPLHV